MPACDASKTAAQYKVAASWRLGRGRCTDHSLPHGFARVEFVLVGHDHVTAFIQPVGHFRKIQRAKSDTSSPSIVCTLVRSPSIGDRTSALFIWASNFLVVASSELRLRSRSIRSVSTAPRSRFASLLAF